MSNSKSVKEINLNFNGDCDIISVNLENFNYLKLNDIKFVYNYNYDDADKHQMLSYNKTDIILINGVEIFIISLNSKRLKGKWFIKKISIGDNNTITLSNEKTNESETLSLNNVFEYIKDINFPKVILKPGII